MRLYTIYGALIFERQTLDFKSLVNEAIKEGVDLKRCDFTNTDLSFVNLDGTDLSGSIFKNTNLNGANLSEAMLNDCQFMNTYLFDTCFCGSNLSRSVFSECFFGNTDFAETHLDECSFGGMGLFDMEIHNAYSTKKMHFVWHGEAFYSSSLPLIIHTHNEKYVSFDDVSFSRSEVCSPEMHTALQQIKSLDGLHSQ